MVRLILNTGFSGRYSGRPVVCPRKDDIMPGARGRSLPFGWET
jgi:hypothetical protein